ncbi:CPBP family intramembrane glutamic endopeptidase [Acerihabitans sp. KWT182]|uniref:CPBP family intramembrane glutamic endopeptidase n=1 Tax=Acerihabitans sp. KWT182 TaxID=3157919 RepID=A0AAU7Q6A8_9GAMM
MWMLLAAALACGTIPRLDRTIAAALLFAALMLAVYERVVSWPAILALIFFAMAIAAKRHYRHSRMFSVSAEILLLLCSLGLFMHLFPGFHNPRVVDQAAAGPLSARFSLYLNLDKALVPVLLLACLPGLLSRPPPVASRWYYWMGLALCIPALLGLATLLGGLRVEWHFPPWLGWFILSNVFFVSLAEEALFRGYLMQRLLLWTQNPAIALGGAAFSFGLAHIAGGWMLALFAGLAGLIYGLAWLWSGKLWVATLFHFSLNLTHLLFFTYPFYHPGG